MKAKKNSTYIDILLTTVILCMVLNYGFTSFGIRVGPVVFPIVQLIAILGVFRLILKNIYIFFNRRFIEIIILFVLFFIRIPFDVLKNGVWSLRDGFHYIDMLYVIIAYYETYSLIKKYSYMKEKILNYIEKGLFLSWLFFVITSVPYLNKLLIEISPVYNGQQSQIRLFGYVSFLNIWSTIYMFWNIYKIIYEKKKGLFYFIQIYTNLIFVLIGQSRLGIAIVFIFILYFTISGKYKIVGNIIKKIIPFVVIIITLLLLGLRINLGNRTFDLNYLINLILSTFGKGDNISKLTGISQRLDWWREIFLCSTSSIGIFIFGRGFGVALTSFKSITGSLVREPHNSFLSVYARQGMFGFIIWVKFLLKAVIKFHINFKKTNNKISMITTLILIGFLICAIAEPVFESSYSAVPIYSFIGITEAIIVLDKRKEDSNG